MFRVREESAEQALLLQEGETLLQCLCIAVGKPLLQCRNANYFNAVLSFKYLCASAVSLRIKELGLIKLSSVFICVNLRLDKGVVVGSVYSAFSSSL